MSGTNSALPMADAARMAPVNSRVATAKTSPHTARTGGCDPASAPDGNAKGENNQMETNLEGRVHTFDQSVKDAHNVNGGGKDAAGADFNAVLNKKINHKAENAAKSGDEVSMPPEEVALNPFVHTTAQESTEAGSQAQAPAPADGASGEQGLNLLAKNADSGEKTLFQQIHGQVAEKSAEQTEGQLKGLNTTAEGKETAVEASNLKNMASEQGLNAASQKSGGIKADENGEIVMETPGKEISAAATADKAGKEVVAEVIPERVGKEIKGLVQDQQPTAEAGQQEKVDSLSQANAFGQSGQGQDQAAGDSDGNATAGQGLELENTDVQVDKGVHSTTKAFELADVDTPKVEHGMAGQQLDSVEQVSRASSISETKASGDAAPAGVTRPIDQIVQQLNVVDSTVSNQRIQMTLTPHDLGTVRITFQQMEGEIVGMVEVQKEQTRREVEEAIPELVSAMQQNGLQVRKVEVAQWNESDPQAGKDDASQGFSLAQEREFAQQSGRDASGSSAFRQSAGEGQTTQPGAIPMKEVAYSEQGQSQKGLNFWV